LRSAAAALFSAAMAFASNFDHSSSGQSFRGNVLYTVASGPDSPMWTRSTSP